MAVPAHGLPLALFEGLEVAIVPPALKGPRRRLVRSCTDAAGGQLVSFSGVDDLSAAAKLVGKSVLARVADMPASLMARDVDALLGRAVVDARLGCLGTVVEVMRGSAQDVWVVEGDRGEVLLPAVEPIVDLATLAGDGPVCVEVPKGLVEDDAL